MKAGVIILIVLAALIGVGIYTVTNQQEPAASERLPDNLRSLLQEEMRLLNTGVQSIDAALKAGDEATVASVARQMHDSFILRQKLTPGDIRRLKFVMGADFVLTDKAFHGTALELSQAAQAGDAERQTAIFQSLKAACVSCHERYAPASVAELVTP
ncbi:MULTISPECIES: cytochrome c [Kordiimonas]|jgi:cytochrome c556|uniref:cytochrome c n=1 Tax=Kordiimonas TaxID=288021 RepID=UPI00257BE5F4|nr:cytochrome c [Kordiimonas sp. UBA4487]